MNTLFVIPARGGSKGIPGKNIKLLNGKPLVHYSIEFARLFAADENICLTTDSSEIISSAEQIGYHTLFTRPAALALDTSGSYEVLQHALDFYSREKQKVYDAVVLLQPTSPFRKKNHLQEALQLYSKQIDMVVSVHESSANPYYNLFEETGTGTLRISKGDGSYTRRQDVPPVYAYNGSIYIINTHSLLQKKSFKSFDKIIKYEMPASYSLDLDEPGDWDLAEYLEKKIKYD